MSPATITITSPPEVPLTIRQKNSLANSSSSTSVRPSPVLPVQSQAKLEDCRQLFAVLFKIKDEALKDRIMKAINGVSTKCAQCAATTAKAAKTVSKKECGTQTTPPDFSTLLSVNKAANSHPDWDANGRVIKRRVRKGPVAVQQKGTPLAVVTAKRVKRTKKPVSADLIKTVSEVK